MARGKYIYLIFTRGGVVTPGQLISAHTVKYEAHTWLERSKWTPEETVLKRMRDGCGHIREPSPYDAKNLDTLEWEFE